MSASLKPPPYAIPYGNHGNEYLGTLMQAFIWVIAGIDTIVVLSRIATKHYLSKLGLWWDDYFILVALIATLIGTALDSVEIHFGFGRHEHFLTKHQVEYFTAYTYGEWIQTFLTLMSQKVSICFFLMRLPVSKTHIRPLQAAVAALILSNIAITLVWILQCHPVKAVWDPDVQGTCLSERQMLDVILAQAIISIVSDFGLSFYPILIIRRLNMNLKQKIGLSILMGLGCITGGCAIVRTVLYERSLPADETYGGITNWFWRLFEVNLGIICACIPALLKGYKWARKQLTGMDIFSYRTMSRRSTAGAVARSPHMPMVLEVRSPHAPLSKSKGRNHQVEPDNAPSELNSGLSGFEEYVERKDEFGVEYSPVALPSQTRQNYNENTRVAEIVPPSTHKHVDTKGRSDPPNWPLVTASNGSKPNLDVNLQPNFEKHRSIFKRLWSSTFDTPMIWTSRNKSSSRSGSQNESNSLV